jgi:hypothetical protein
MGCRCLLLLLVPDEDLESGTGVFCMTAFDGAELGSMSMDPGIGRLEITLRRVVSVGVLDFRMGSGLACGKRIA